MKKASIIFLVAAAWILAACSGAAPTSTAAETALQEQTAVPGLAAEAGIESRLALGTLALEETGNAVTAEQARTLLPLWKAVNALSTSDTATTEEINSLYKQIQDAMTPEQIAAIEALDLSGDTIPGLVAKYVPLEDQAGGSLGQSAGGSGFPGGDFQPPSGGSFPAPGAGGPSFSQGGGGGRAQFGGGDGGPPAGGFVIEGNSADGEPQFQGTPGAGGGRMRMMGMNNLFVQPLITLLKERAG